MVGGEYTGYGISYHKNGNIMYRGHFQQGQPCGKGEIFDGNGKMMYKGGFQDG